MRESIWWELSISWVGINSSELEESILKKRIGNEITRMEMERTREIENKGE